MTKDGLVRSTIVDSYDAGGHAVRRAVYDENGKLAPTKAKSPATIPVRR